MTEFDVEVVFALPDRQMLVRIVAWPDETVADVVAKSGLPEAFDEQQIKKLAVGIWGREVPPSEVVKAGDRIEIYRPLHLDPREARRRLALSGRTMGRTESG